MALRHSYTVLAPVYDAIVDRATRSLRRASLADLPADPGRRVLLGGVGTGLDFPFLPHGPAYTGIDLTPAMLARARRRADHLGLAIKLTEGDAMALPHGDATFDDVILHLIVAVVPEPKRVLAEAARVVRPGGTVRIVDKFLPADRPARLRRALNPLISRIATRTDVVFEEVLAGAPDLKIIADEAGPFGGWFRRIRLERRPR
jgi:phosphatidylethanolamine/phosphatidyl-N-methylethanolamine N-methyltransferase